MVGVVDLCHIGLDRLEGSPADDHLGIDHDGGHGGSEFELLHLVGTGPDESLHDEFGNGSLPSEGITVVLQVEPREAVPVGSDQRPHLLDGAADEDIPFEFGADGIVLADLQRVAPPLERIIVGFCRPMVGQSALDERIRNEVGLEGLSALVLSHPAEVLINLSRFQMGHHIPVSPVIRLDSICQHIYIYLSLVWKP